jgi:CheY-like chemotaxis protein
VAFCRQGVQGDVVLTDLDKSLREFESRLGIGQAKPQSKSLPPLMVVDDDPGFLRSLVDTLSDDYEVIACSSGQEALQKLETRICTVILDIKMPGMGGLEVIKEIKKRFPELPVIFNTGYPGEYMEARIEQEYQPFGYVTKDNPQILMAHLKSAVKHFHLTQSYLELIENLEKKVEDRTGEIEQALKNLEEAKNREEYLNQQLRIQEVMRTGEDIAAGILHDNKNCMQPIENVLYFVPYIVDILGSIFADAKSASNDLSDKLKEVGVDTKRGNLLWRSLLEHKDLAISASEEILKGYEYYRQVYNPRENGNRDLNKDLEASVFLTIDRND